MKRYKEKRCKKRVKWCKKEEGCWTIEESERAMEGGLIGEKGSRMKGSGKDKKWYVRRKKRGERQFELVRKKSKEAGDIVRKEEE